MEYRITANFLKYPVASQISRRRLEYPASPKSPVILLLLSAPVNYANFSVMGTSPLVMSFKNAASGL
jgi:hypothetical protein